MELVRLSSRTDYEYWYVRVVAKLRVMVSGVEQYLDQARKGYIDEHAHHHLD